MAAKVKWPTKRLGELAEFRNGVNYNKSSFGEGVKVVGVSDFQDYTKPRYGELEQINPKASSPSATFSAMVTSFSFGRTETAN